MAAPKPSSKQMLASTHSFFGTLPRELRDNIYDLLHQDIEWVNDHVNSRMHLRAPIPAVRLVNHQFKLEYEERMAQGHLSKLAVYSYSRFIPILAQRPRLAAYTTDLTFNFLACNSSHNGIDGRCNSVDLLPVLKNWIDEFIIRLPRLCTIRISIAVIFDSCIYDTLLALSAFTTIPKVVEVTLGPVRRPEPFATSDNDARTLATWTPQRGMVHNHEAFKKCMEEDLLASWLENLGGRGTWDGAIFPS